MPPASAGALDDMQHWTGDVVEHDGKVYLFYTARSSREDGLVQRIMTAQSSDFVHWTRSTVPVMVADPRWYLTEAIPERANTVSWRDPKIVWDADRRMWHAFLAADEAVGRFASRACIAHAISADLVHWEIQPPVFAPRRYACLEVPDVFRIGDLWYLTALTGSIYGNSRDAIRDPRVTNGVVYAVSDRIDGPFSEPHENVLFGSQDVDAASCRSVLVDGLRYAYYLQFERLNAIDAGPLTLGVLAAPKTVGVDGSGRLRLEPSDAAQSIFDRRVPVGLADIAHSSLSIGSGEWRVNGDALEAADKSGWSARCAPSDLSSLDVSVSITLRDSGRAGLILRAEPNAMHPAPGPDEAALAVLIDTRDGSVELLTLRQFRVLCGRTIPLVVDRTYQLRVMMFGEFMDVFLDGALMFSTTRYQPRTGMLGLFVENAGAVFQSLEARSPRTFDAEPS